MTERERLLEKLGKVKALADRGEGGEKESAERTLAALMKRYGITEEDLEDKKVTIHWIRYKTDWERRLLGQLAYMHLGTGHSFGCVGRYTKRPRKEVGIECTPAQYIEIEADFAFYSEAMKEEMELFYSAFLQKNGLFPPPELAAEPTEAEKEEWEDLERERAMKRAEYERKAAKLRAAERRRRAARRRVITLALGALAVVMILASVIMTITAKPAAEAAEAEITGAAVTSPPVTLVTAEPDMWDGEGEDPLEAEKIEEALLASGYFSVAVPMCYEYQDYMRTYCAAYECPYPLALAVAEVESHFDMDAVGAAGEVGIMQLNPGPENTYWINLEAETELDPTTPSGNIAAGCYLLGKYMQEYGDPNKAAMAYNMGVSGAENAWAEGITSTDYSTAVVEAMERWEVTVNAWNGI